jgi:hypothetical protein
MAITASNSTNVNPFFLFNFFHHLLRVYHTSSRQTSQFAL